MSLSRRTFFALGLALAVAAASCGIAEAASGGTFIYKRIFKESVPEYIEIKIPEGSANATAEVRQLSDDAGAASFELTPALRTRIFELVAQLNHFKGLDLDVHRKIANLGEKTFRWENGAESYEVKFNYTLNTPATQLLQICEGLAREQELIELLQRRMKYDRLGVNDALMQMESDLNKSVLPEPQRMLPLLDQISGDSRFVDIARQRARTLAERMRHGN